MFRSTALIVRAHFAAFRVPSAFMTSRSHAASWRVTRRGHPFAHEGCGGSPNRLLVR